MWCGAVADDANEVVVEAGMRLDSKTSLATPLVELENVFRDIPATLQCLSDGR